MAVVEYVGAFNSTKNSETFDKGTNGAKISWESSQKIRKLLKFRKPNHSNATENCGRNCMD